MKKPILIIINGLPGSGKTTLAKRLSQNVGVPVFSRDGIYESLFDALDCDTAKLGSASFSLLYSIAGSILAAGQPLIIEGFFGRPDLRSAEFLRLQQQHDFEPLQILCKADGAVLLERFLARAGSADRHAGHSDMAWLEQNRERLLRGQLEPLALDGQVIEIDTSTPDGFDYEAVLRQVRSVLS